MNISANTYIIHRSDLYLCQALGRAAKRHGDEQDLEPCILCASEALAKEIEKLGIYCTVHYAAFATEKIHVMCPTDAPLRLHLLVSIPA